MDSHHSCDNYVYEKYPQKLQFKFKVLIETMLAIESHFLNQILAA